VTLGALAHALGLTLAEFLEDIGGAITRSQCPLHRPFAEKLCPFDASLCANDRHIDCTENQ
jgi:hypothetical protein